MQAYDGSIEYFPQFIWKVKYEIILPTKQKKKQKRKKWIGKRERLFQYKYDGKICEVYISSDVIFISWYALILRWQTKLIISSATLKVSQYCLVCAISFFSLFVLNKNRHFLMVFFFRFEFLFILSLFFLYPDDTIF